jgi:hypothetical protein
VSQDGDEKGNSIYKHDVTGDGDILIALRYGDWNVDVFGTDSFVGGPCGFALSQDLGQICLQLP